jgi:hypothetical protein
MSVQKLPLGKALAYLKAERARGKTCYGEELSATEKSHLQFLRERVQAMSSPDDVNRVLQALPERCCQTEIPFLAGNEDFFLARFLCHSQDGNGSDDCERLFKHLNDCFRCFEEFSLVMLEYYHQSQGLSQNP